MCGRYASSRSAADLAALFDARDDAGEELAPNYNIAPTDPAPIIRMSVRAGGPVLTVARWGLVPAWSKVRTGAARMINARCETVATSPAFAPSLQRRRCLVPADGWYEWVAPVGSASPAGAGKRAGRQPYFMTRTDGAQLGFGGLWSSWSGPDGNRLRTFSIVTLAAAGALAGVHDRMPLILEPGSWTDWLAGSDPAGLLRPPGEPYVAGIEQRRVSPAVGDVRNSGAVLIAPLDGTQVASTVDALF